MTKLNHLPVDLPASAILTEQQQLAVKGGEDDGVIIEDLIQE